MRFKLALTLLLLAMLACTATGTPLLAPQPASPSESENLTEATSTPENSPPAETLPPYSGDTPSPPTLAAPVVSTFSVTSLHMINELDGWAISENTILRTTDGGLTWYNVSPQGVTEFGYGTGNTFLDAMQAWVLVADASDPVGAGLLYRTSDGGLTWTTLPVPFGNGDLTFLDENTGWLMLSLGVAAGSMAVSIYRTGDGGATWTQKYTNDPNLANSGNSLPLGGIKSNLTPLDRNTAWIGGVIYAPETFYLYTTGDGGQTWASQTIPAAPSMQSIEVLIDTGPIFMTTTDGILPVRFTGETNRTGFYATHDGGSTWEFVTFMPGAGATDFVSPSDGFFWNGEQFYVTVDGANTWSSIDSIVPFSESFSGMDFVNTRTGWVWTYDDGIYKTTDGGITWFSLGN